VPARNGQAELFDIQPAPNKTRPLGTRAVMPISAWPHRTLSVISCAGPWNKSNPIAGTEFRKRRSCSGTYQFASE
jgi:hypothetical protein